MMKLLTYKTVFFLVILVSLCVKSPYSASQEVPVKQDGLKKIQEEFERLKEEVENEKLEKEDNGEEQEQENQGEEEQYEEYNPEVEEIEDENGENEEEKGQEENNPKGNEENGEEQEQEENNQKGNEEKENNETGAEFKENSARKSSGGGSGAEKPRKEEGPEEEELSEGLAKSYSMMYRSKQLNLGEENEEEEPQNRENLENNIEIENNAREQNGEEQKQEDNPVENEEKENNKTGDGFERNSKEGNFLRKSSRGGSGAEEPRKEEESEEKVITKKPQKKTKTMVTIRERKKVIVTEEPSEDITDEKTGKVVHKPKEIKIVNEEDKIEDVEEVNDSSEYDEPTGKKIKKYVKKKGDIIKLIEKEPKEETKEPEEEEVIEKEEVITKNPKTKSSRRYRKKNKKKGQTTEQEIANEDEEGKGIKMIKKRIEEDPNEETKEPEITKSKKKKRKKTRKPKTENPITSEEEPEKETKEKIVNKKGKSEKNNTNAPQNNSFEKEENNSKNISSGRSNNTQKNEIIYRKKNTSKRKGRLLNNIRRPIVLQPSKNMHSNKQNSISNKNLQEDDNDYYDEGSEGEDTEELFKGSDGNLYILKRNKGNDYDLALMGKKEISPVSEHGVVNPGKDGNVIYKFKNDETLQLTRIEKHQIEWSKIVKIKEKYVTLRKFVETDGEAFYIVCDCKTGKKIDLVGDPIEVENENGIISVTFQISGAKKVTCPIKSKDAITNREIKRGQKRLEIEKYIICDLGVNKNNLGIFLSKVKGSNPTKMVALYAVKGYRDDFEKRKRYILCKYFLFAVKPICSFLWAGANGFLHFEEINFNKMYFLKYIVCVGYRWQPTPMAKFGLFLDINISVPSVVHSIISTILKYKIEKFSITSKWKWFLGNIIFYSIPNCFNLNINFKIKNSYIAINFAGIIAELLRNIVIPNVGRYELPNKRISSEQQQEEEKQKEEQKKELSQEEANEQKNIELKNIENSNNNMDPNINNKNLNINNKNLNINKNLNNNMIPNINMNPNNNKENENINKEDLNQQDNAQGGGSVVNNQASDV